MQFGFGLAMTNMRGVPVVDPIATRYGVDMLQVPLHHPAEAASLDTDQNVTTVMNRGGAGSMFDATASAKGMTRSGSLLILPPSAYLMLKNPTNLVGTRMFFAAKPDPAMDRYARIMGNTSPENLVRIDKDTGQFLLMRAGMGIYLAGSGSPVGTDLNLYEIEIAGGQAKLIVNGVQLSQAACSWTDFAVTMIGAAFSGIGYQGGLGNPFSVITDGAPEREATMLALRRELAAKHGKTLP